MSALDRLKHDHGDPLRVVIHHDGRIEKLKKPESMAQLKARMRANTIDTVILLDREHVMLVDDVGALVNAPHNVEATRLYLDRCRPGTQHTIRGTVCVVPDDDFAGPL